MYKIKVENSWNHQSLNVLFFLVAILLLIPLQSSVAKDDYKTYGNARFGYEIDYPSNLLQPQGEPINSDGQVFLSKNGDSEMRAYGRYLVDYTFDEEYKNALVDKWGQAGKPVITYKAQGKDWFAVSGTISGKIFYRKSCCRKDTMRSVTFLYPATLKAAYAKVVGRVVSSFKWAS
jgi:hypothetical protein